MMKINLLLIVALCVASACPASCWSRWVSFESRLMKPQQVVDGRSCDLLSLDRAQALTKASFPNCSSPPLTKIYVSRSNVWGTVSEICLS